MIAPKSTLSLLVVAALVIATFTIVSCNENSRETKEETIVTPAEPADTTILDSATVRPVPVKTTN